MASERPWRPRVVHIVDDDPDILASVSFMLRTEAMDVTTHESAGDFLEMLPDLRPGCILLDIHMPGMTGLELQKRLHESRCRMPVIFITGHGDVDSAVDAMKEGAVDFLQKPFAKQDLIAAIDTAWDELSHPLPDPRERREAVEKLASLTPRERQVVEALAHGHANKVTAYELGISPRTVELYRANAMRKLEARSLSEMLQVAFLAGMKPR